MSRREETVHDAPEVSESEGSVCKGEDTALGNAMEGV
jgi:hypothetical protein